MIPFYAKYLAIWAPYWAWECKGWNIAIMALGLLSLLFCLYVFSLYLSRTVKDEKFSYSNLLFLRGFGALNNSEAWAVFIFLFLTCQGRLIYEEYLLSLDFL